MENKLEHIITKANVPITLSNGSNSVSYGDFDNIINKFDADTLDEMGIYIVND